MNSITINKKLIKIVKHGSLLDFFNSMTSTACNLKYFKLETDESEKMNLIIIEIKSHESMSGTGFHFKAIGESFQKGNDGPIPIITPLEGFIDF